MKDRYIITQNVTGGFKFSFRNIIEAAIIASTMGLFVIYGTGALSTVMRGAVLVFLCIIPTILAITGIYSMSLFQFLSVQTKRARGMNFFYRLPTEDELLEGSEDKKKDKKKTKKNTETTKKTSKKNKDKKKKG